MEPFLVFCLIVIGIARWLYVRDRMARLNQRIEELTARFDAQTRFVGELNARTRPAPAESIVQQTAPVEPAIETLPPQPEPLPPPQVVEAPPVPPRPVEIPVAAAARSSEDWEALLGGNWLNKIGVFVLVVGIALALGYSFTQFGPVGRVSISIAASLAMLVSGALVERRERYKTFGRGLLGGGWAALYVTVYAMHAVESARVIESAAAGAFLLLAVAAGMIAHSLLYRSQTVTGLAYFVAFGTLALTDMTSLPFAALVPLAASLLYIAHRFRWLRMTLLGLIATYGVVVLRGDTGAPLWKAQAIFAVYWLLFEIFDVLHPEAWLLPLNAAGALGLSVMKWHTAAPDEMWMLLAGAAVAYAVSALARVRSGKGQGAATLTAALAAGAIFQKLDRQWVASALVVEAELFYLAGIRLRAPYLRWLGTSLFGVEALRLLAIDMWVLPLGQWTAVASLDAAIFYANRALYAADFFFGYAGAGMFALVIGNELPEPSRSVAWQAAGAGAFAFGWWRRLSDFRFQGYLLLAVGLCGTALECGEAPLAVAAVVCYAAVWCALWPAQDRMTDEERSLVRLGGGGLAVAALMTLAWRIVPGDYLGVTWMALALLVLELGLRQLPENFRRLAYAAAAIGAFRVWTINVAGLANSGPWAPRLIPLWAALASYALAWRARREEAGMAFMGASTVALVFGVVALWMLLPVRMVAAAWALAALALLLAERQSKREVLAWQGYVVAGIAYLFCLVNLPDLSHAVWSTCVTIAALYAAQLTAQRTGYRRLYFSLMASTLTTALLYYRITGSMLTVACGVEGVILLVAGFPFRDRVLRISGLVLLLACILKLFVWDLRHLETLPRIVSFIVLGIILLGVSWVYTRFRERVARFL